MRSYQGEKAYSVQYIHRPIPKDADEIRLIRFIDSTNIQIFHQHLCDKPRYRALSYTWGGQKCDQPLRVVVSPDSSEKARTLMITKNCMGALERLFLDSSTIPVWIDSICINQHDDQERNHQVGLMGKIYQCAEKVQIDLGEEGPNTRQAIKYLQREDEFVQSSGSPLQFFHYTEHAPQDVQSGISDILTRSWFRRLWVLQEVHFAKQAEALCGGGKIPWRALRIIGLHFYENGGSVVRMVDNGVIAKQAAPKLPPILAISEGGLTAKTLEEWIRETDSLECSDPRDTIYALLGLASDVQSAALNILPDYTKTVADIYRLIAKQYAIRALKDACSRNGLEVELDQQESVERIFDLAFEAAVRKKLKSFSVSETQKLFVRRILGVIDLPKQTLLWYLNFCTAENEIAIPATSKIAQKPLESTLALIRLKGGRTSSNVVAFSVDGNFVAFALEDINVKVLKVASGKVVQSLARHNKRVTGLAFSLDGALLVSSSKDKIVRVHELVTGSVLKSLSVSTSEVDFLFTKDGKCLEVNQFILKIESPLLEVIGTRLKPPPSFYLSNSKFSSNSWVEISTLTRNGDGAETASTVYLGDSVPIPPLIMREWEDSISGHIKFLLETEFSISRSLNLAEFIAFRIVMAGKRKRKSGKSGFVALSPTIVIGCSSLRGKRVIEEIMSKQKFGHGIQLIVCCEIGKPLML